MSAFSGRPERFSRIGSYAGNSAGIEGGHKGKGDPFRWRANGRQPEDFGVHINVKKVAGQQDQNVQKNGAHRHRKAGKLDWAIDVFFY